MSLLATLRQHRRLTGACLLCLLFVLLPLRGWAEVVMHTGALSTNGLPAADSAAHLPPCHAGLAEAGVEMPVDGAADAGLACSLCALCQAPALCTCEPVLVTAPAAAVAPQAVRAGHQPPALPLPERPPRA